MCGLLSAQDLGNSKGVQDSLVSAIQVIDDSYASPDFTVSTLQGGEFTLSTQAGKPVVLFFLAYWSGSGVPEAQALGRLYEKYGDAITIVALDMDPTSDREHLLEFRAAAGNPGYIWAFDTSNSVVRAYRVRSLDTTIILDQGGQKVFSDKRPSSYKTLAEQIEKLLP